MYPPTTHANDPAKTKTATNEGNYCDDEVGADEAEG
jgi:hypothetical protein